LREFLQQRLTNIDQIEIVLLLRRNPDRSWAATELAAELRSAPESAAMRLFLLASSGLVLFEAAGLPRYRYEPADAALDELLAELDAVYADDPATVNRDRGRAASRSPSQLCGRIPAETVRRRTMLANLVYVLCALTSATCAVLLYRGYRRSQTRLLFWSAVCFVGLAVNNLFLIVDLRVVPAIDLSAWRLLPALIGVGALVYSLIWESR
jgi:hypothetical protein